jgi:hypothetical protein
MEKGRESGTSPAAYPTWYICSGKGTVMAIKRAFTGCKKTYSQGRI